MTDFLDKLGDQLSNQFSLGENTNKTIELGKFAKQLDRSAERRYLEEGYLRQDAYNASPRQMEILLQEPNATILVKKKMFSSLGENFRPDFMDAEEKLYYKAMKVLFQNKCNQIATLEKLSKIQKVSSAFGNINEQLLPAIFSLSDSLTESFNGAASFAGSSAQINPFAGDAASNLSKTVDRVRQLYAYNSPSNITKWITDTTNFARSEFGEGTGVIEITNFTGFSTNCSVNLDPSPFSLNIEDPYRAMLITPHDIERAIADANNFFNNSKIFQFGKESADQVIENAKTELNRVRALRKASPISFRLNPDTLIGKRVVAIIDRIGLEIVFRYDETGGGIFPGIGGAVDGSVHIDAGYLKDGEQAGFDGLESTPSKSPFRNKKAESEASIFKRLISAIFNKMQLEANSKNAVIQNNKSTNYIRRKLTLNFMGKLILQEQDPIHIYINSKARFDNKVLAGMKSMFSGVGMLQNLNNTITDFKNTANNLFNPGGSVPLQVEKSVFVGDDFPNYLWNIMRDQFVTEKEGTHVFGGIIGDASDSWSNGRFTVAVSGRDNAEYFNQGKVNFKPSVDTYNGVMYDPMTPFETSIDDVGGVSKQRDPVLLKENQALINAGLLKKKMGPFSGEKIKSNNYIEDASIDKNTGVVSKVMYAPDGFVHKWKEGIAVFTQSGRSQDVNDPNRAGSVNVYEEPFAGLDVMNVLSLLVSGVPYNFATYYRATADKSGFGNDPQTKQGSSGTFYDALRQGLTKSNAIWGNFIPFKNLVMDEQSYVLALTSQFAITKQNKDLDKKLQQLSDLNNNIMLYGAANFLSNKQDYYTDQVQELKLRAQLLTMEIQGAVSQINTDEKAFANVFDTNASYDTDEFNNQSDPNKAANDPSIRRHLRRKSNFLTRRMSYDVRANVDKNLFIVDDTYDKDYDIMAYNKSLAGNMSLYNSNIMSPFDKIKATADLLNLEVFCDTQGHIRARSPQYNRMPSSVFYRMMFLKDSTGVQIFPQFLSDFFNSKLESLRSQVEIIEDQIRLDCAVLGYNSDQDALKFILTGNNLEGNGQAFNFISDNESGLITDIDNLLKQSNPTEGGLFGESQSIGDFEKIKQQAVSTKNIFTNSQRFSAVLTVLAEQTSKAEGVNPTSNDINSLQNNNYITRLVDRINTKSGVKVTLENYTIAKTAGVKNLEFSTNKGVDVFKTTKELGERVKERQGLMRTFYNAIKNSSEYKSLDNGSSTASSVFPSGNYGNSHVPEVYEHMIEDESYDDYGVGSGLRYIIKTSQILGSTIGSKSPEYTTVQVNGIISDFNLDAPNQLGIFQGGNALTTAVAVDYDLWRNYGFKTPHVISVPFLSDPETQCAPYASMILSRARKNILRGTLTIVGNEFMQPGEIVYVEDRGLLFYVEEVQHSFTYGSQFTTTLTLSYGHTPGEYIPTYLDVIGKMIYKNRDVGHVTVQRQDSSRNESSLGCITRRATSMLSGDDGENQTFTAEDRNTLKNIIYYATYKMSGSQKTDTVKTMLEVRIYHSDNIPLNPTLESFANDIKSLITGQSTGTDLSLGDPTKPSDSTPTVSADLVNVVTVNLDDKDSHKSPSQKAISAARSKAEGSSIQISGQESNVSQIGDKITEALFGYIVDCWVTIEDKGSK